jgi:hypothetical protein
MHVWVALELTYAVVAALANRFRRLSAPKSEEGVAVATLASRAVAPLLASQARGRLDTSLVDCLCEVVPQLLLVDAAAVCWRLPRRTRHGR